MIVVRDGGICYGHCHAVAPGAVDGLNDLLDHVGLDSRRVVRCPGGSRRCARKNKRTDSLRICRGEQSGHHRSFAGAHYDGALDTHLIDDRAYVGHPLLEERKPVERNWIGEPDPTLVE